MGYLFRSSWVVDYATSPSYLGFEINMQAFPTPSNEAKRLAALRNYEVLDTESEAEYDALTKLASDICGTPFSLITLIDESRQWFKSAQGTDVRESPREYAFCTHAIMQPEAPMIVPDLRRDERFAQNPFVTQDPHVVFYASVPLTDADGFALGSLCVLDVIERDLTEAQLNALRVLANQVVTLMQLKRRLNNAQTVKGMLGERAEELGSALQLVLDAAPALGSAVGTLELLAKSEGTTTSAQAKADIQESLRALQTVSAALDKAGDAV